MASSEKTFTWDEMVIATGVMKRAAGKDDPYGIFQPVPLLQMLFEHRDKIVWAKLPKPSKDE